MRNRALGTSFSRETRYPSTWSHCTAGGDYCAVNPSASEVQLVTLLSDDQAKPASAQLKISGHPISLGL